MRDVAEAKAEIERGAAEGPFQPEWESLRACHVPAWYQDAKFGIFIHWGVYSVPAFGKAWHPRQMYARGARHFEQHVATYGPQDKFGYKEFIPKFTAHKFDADAWAGLFRRAGGVRDVGCCGTGMRKLGEPRGTLGSRAGRAWDLAATTSLPGGAACPM